MIHFEIIFVQGVRLGQDRYDLHVYVYIYSLCSPTFPALKINEFNLIPLTDGSG